jgi:hypothetical protein
MTSGIFQREAQFLAPEWQQARDLYDLPTATDEDAVRREALQHRLDVVVVAGDHVERDEVPDRRLIEQ